MNKPKLIIFDLDGTLVDRDSEEPLSHVAKYFMDYGLEIPIAICTNQGGVGLRYWMEKDGFGKPEEYPTEWDALNHIIHSLNRCGIPFAIPIYVCYRYLSKKGQWSPLPPDKENDPEWDSANRKPNPGMLIRAMKNTPIEPEDVLFVGDSEDDHQAAIQAGVSFRWAKDFFHRDC